MYNMGAESQSVARAVDILELLAENGSLGVRDIARRMTLSPTIVHRLLSTLASTGFAEQAPDTQKYRIGYRAFRIGCSFLSQNDLDRASTPELVALAEQHQVNSFLGVLRDHAVVYLKVVKSNGPIAINNAPGSLALPHSTAFGKVLLAALSDKQVAEVMGREPYKKLTRKTKVSLRALLSELREIRVTGIAISDEENLPNVYSVGAAVRDASGAVVASLSGAVPRQGLNKRDIDNLCVLVKNAADSVSRKMGAPPASLAMRGR
jgi:DNA-binding IclR family transcriptional regulator